MSATPSLLDDFNQFMHEQFPKVEREQMSKEKRNSIWITVLMLAVTLGGAVIGFLLWLATGGVYGGILIILSGFIGFGIERFGSWYDRKYHL